MKSRSAARQKRPPTHTELLQGQDEVKACVLQVMKKHTGSRKPRQLTTVSISLESPPHKDQVHKSIHDNCLPYHLGPSAPKVEEPKRSRSRTVEAERVLQRWRKQSWAPSGVDGYLGMKSSQFRRVKFNIYILQRSALKIQHWYFRKKVALQRRQGQNLSTASLISYKRVADDITKTLQEKDYDELKRLVAKRTSPNSPASDRQQHNSHVKIAQRSSLKRSPDQGSVSRNLHKGRGAEDHTVGVQSFEYSLLGPPSKDAGLQQPLSANQSMITPRTRKTLDKFNSMAKSIEEQTYYHKHISPLKSRPVVFRPSKEMQEALCRSDKAKTILDNFARERDFMNKKRGSFSSLPIEEDKQSQQEAAQIQWVPLRSPRPLTMYGSAAVKEFSAQRELSRNGMTPQKAQTTVAIKQSGSKPTHHRQSPLFEGRKSSDSSKTPSPIVSLSPPKANLQQPLKFLAGQVESSMPASPGWKGNAKIKEPKFTNSPVRGQSPPRFTTKTLQDTQDPQPEEVFTLRNSIGSSHSQQRPSPERQSTVPDSTQSPNPIPKRKSPQPVAQDKILAFRQKVASPIIQSKQTMSQSPAGSQKKSTSIGKQLNAILKKKLQRLEQPEPNSSLGEKKSQISILSKFTVMKQANDSAVRQPVAQAQPTAPANKGASQTKQPSKERVRVEPLKTSTLYGVKKLTDYKRIQKSKDRVPIKETPRTALPQPEKKPVLLAN